MKKAVIISLIALAVAAVLFVACSHRDGNVAVARIFATSIEQLKTTPERYEDKTVLIAGEVTHSGGIGRKSAYMVDDGTDAIWVLDHTSAPAVGTEVKIQGTVEQWVRLGNKTMTVFRAKKE